MTTEEMLADALRLIRTYSSLAIDWDDERKLTFIHDTAENALEDMALAGTPEIIAKLEGMTECNHIYGFQEDNHGLESEPVFKYCPLCGIELKEEEKE